MLTALTFFLALWVTAFRLTQIMNRVMGYKDSDRGGGRWTIAACFLWSVWYYLTHYSWFPC